MGLDIKTLAATKKIVSNIKTDLTESSIISALGYTPINSNKIGSYDGIATLDANGKIPTSQLPSYVSDVIEVNGINNASKNGESDKIYVDTVTNKTYRWSGTAYIEISASDIVTSSETNGNIKVNGSEISVYTHPSGTNPHGTTKDDVGLGNVENKSSATIREELTKANITKALGYTPPTSAKVLYDFWIEENLASYFPLTINTANNGKFDYYILQYNNGIMIVSIYMVRPNLNYSNNCYTFTFPISFINNRYHVVFSPQGTGYDVSPYNKYPSISQNSKTNSSFTIDTAGAGSREDNYMETMEGVNAICIGRWK